MTRWMLRGALLTTALGVAGCHREASPGPAAATVTTTVPPGVGMDGVTKPLLRVLADENAHRPGGTPGGDALFDALDKAGIAMQGRSQVLGRTVGAAFCENAHTPQGIVVSVCEFTDAGALAKGRAYSEKAFATALPDRVFVVSKNTLLTINPPAGTAPAAQIDKIKRTFLAL